MFKISSGTVLTMLSEMLTEYLSQIWIIELVQLLYVIKYTIHTLLRQGKALVLVPTFAGTGFTKLYL